MFDVALLSRWQFALTSIYHWLFVPVTLGMTVVVAIMEIYYARTKDEIYAKMAKFWGGLFLINFAMGVVTGIVQEFHFGMNWAEYSRFMGDIFGAPLALEALTAFFLESTFIGAWIFGWKKFSPKVHACIAVLVAIGSNLSAFWILVANSFMQHPVGYVLRNGRAEMTDFGAVLGNPYAHAQWLHIFTDGIMFAGTIIAAVSAWHIIRKSHLNFYMKSIKWGLVSMLIGGILVLLAGHHSGQVVYKYQPMKIASAEALYHSEKSAPFTIFAIVDPTTKTKTAAIEIPGLLSILTQNNPNASVQGIDEVQAQMVAQHGPGEYTPEVASLFYVFRIMVYFGSITFLIALVSYISYRRGNLQNNKFLLKVLLFTLICPYLANSAGWYVAEGGRQPWIVYGLQLTSDGVSKAISATDVWISIIGFTLVYVLAAIAAIYLAVKHIKAGPEGNEAHDVVETKKEATLWN